MNFYVINAASRETGVHESSLRRWEEIALITPGSRGPGQDMRPDIYGRGSGSAQAGQEPDRRGHHATDRVRVGGSKRRAEVRFKM